MQDEQGLLDVKRPAPLGAASPSIEAVDAIPEVWPEGVHFYRHTPEHGRVEILRVTGDRRMFSCMGYGIPDRHAVQDHNIRPWLGFAEQVMYAALRTRHLLDLWAAGQRKVTLYGNVEVTCADPESYVLATYTPSVVVDGEDPKATAPFGDVLTERPATAAHWGLS
jgi:hypothetical protein